MTASILPEFQHCQIRRHLFHGCGTRLVRVLVSGKVEVTGAPGWHISPKIWRTVGRIEDVMQEIGTINVWAGKSPRRHKRFSVKPTLPGKSKSRLPKMRSPSFC